MLGVGDDGWWCTLVCARGFGWMMHAAAGRAFNRSGRLRHPGLAPAEWSEL